MKARNKPMKPFRGFNLSENKKDPKANGYEFIVQAPSPELLSALQRSKGKLDTAEKKAKLPLILRIVEWITAIAGVAILLGIFKATTDEDPVPFSKILNEMPELIVAGLVLVAIALLIQFFEKRRENSVYTSDENNLTLSHLVSSVDTIFSDLGVPENAREVDILSFLYKDKEGEAKLTVKAKQNFMFLNQSFKIFADPKTFYLVNIEGKFAFSRRDVKAIRTVSKRATLNEWNKDYPFDDERYKKYKIVMDQYGVIYVKNYYILELDIDGQIWGIYFPPYELPLFEALTGLKVDES